MDTDFKVKVGQFEGPVELLLELVEKRKLHISEVSLSKVADDFIEYTQSFEDFPVSDSADFILIASTLLLIKSKSLLPNLELTEEEKVSIEELENRLATYKKYKDLTSHLNKMFGRCLFFANEKKTTETVFRPATDLSLINLQKSLVEVLKNMPQPAQELPKVAVAKVISLEEMMDRLSMKIRQSLKTSFKDFSKSADETDGSTNLPQIKLNVIVSFLAMLELVKRGLARVEQKEHFQDISIENEKVEVPRY